MIVMIDHDDSFTDNLVQYLGELGRRVRVNPGCNTITYMLSSHWA